MKKILLFFLFLSFPVMAADNAVIVTPGTGVTMRSIDVGGGVQSMGNSLVNSSGTNIIGAGTTVPVSGSLTNISGTISLPTGAATAANQATEITSLASIATSATTIATNTGAAIPAGSATIGSVGVVPIAGNGCTGGHIISVSASNNVTAIKASPGTLCSLTIVQTSTTLGDFRLYDLTSATCSSATGVVANVPIQSNAVSPGVSPNLGPFGMNFATGISFCLTGAVADNDNTNLGTTGVLVNYTFK